LGKHTARSYVSSHVYLTPTGMYYDDRTGKRLTGRRGAASGRSHERMKARVRDESRKLSYKRIKVNTDFRDRQAKGKHVGSPNNADFEVDTIYDSDINESLASSYVEKRLDREDAENDHFNVSFLGDVEE